jgi:toxin-antitoxin system PIN domain toxin
VFVVDTNVLIYAADADGEGHGPCRKALEEWRRQQGAWYITWGIVYEFLRVTTHAKVLRNPWTAQQAWQFIQALLQSPGLDILLETERHGIIFEQVCQEVPYLSGNLIHDAHTAVLMREHGIRRVYTRDTDFHRFPFLEVVDPLQK